MDEGGQKTQTSSLREQRGLFNCVYYEKMDVSRTYRGNHFPIYINQTITLYILNLYSDVHQLFCNKTEKKKKSSKSLPSRSFHPSGDRVGGE